MTRCRALPYALRCLLAAAAFASPACLPGGSRSSAGPDTSGSTPAREPPTLDFRVKSSDATHFRVDKDFIAVLALCQLAGELETRSVAGGLRIQKVAAGSVAGRVGLGVDDVIISIEDYSIRAPADFKTAYAITRGRSTVDVALLRAGQKVTIHYELDDTSSAQPDSTRALPRRRPSPRSTGALPDDFADGIVAKDTTHYTVRRDLFERLREDSDIWARSARVVPVFRDGEADGFKLYGIRSDSLFRTLGLRNGDHVRMINGRTLDSLDTVMDLSKRPAASDRYTVAILRRGSEMSIHYDVVD